MKRKYIRNEAKLRQTQGCLTDCVAYYFNIHPANVPLFIYPRKTWMKKLRAFFKKQGCRIFWGSFSDIKNIKKINKGLRIVVGNSRIWKTAGHCVVYKGNKKIYDPDPKGIAMKGEPTHQLLVFYDLQDNQE